MNAAIKCSTIQPDLEDNADLFDALFARVCKRGTSTNTPPEVILCQMIFHASREVFLGIDDVPFSSVKAVVEAAFMDCVNVIDRLDEAGASLTSSPRIKRLINVAPNLSEVRP
ncbi:hypothetical protein FEM54_05210 [Pseudomonas edaphica]|uniref:Uncharacterized protein n=1 Tax=Pseudomonas edaphica TaxID=2006980 RepID=A0ABY2U9D5_9PSED|nr:hypothetical protein [Pseudomonas edaphica]TLG93135.1 hypothetical protein FEM54_05210 [Pseudomonas edaphica]